MRRWRGVLVGTSRFLRRKKEGEVKICFNLGESEPFYHVNSPPKRGTGALPGFATGIRCCYGLHLKRKEIILSLSSQNIFASLWEHLSAFRPCNFQKFAAGAAEVDSPRCARIVAVTFATMAGSLSYFRTLGRCVERT